MLPTKEEVALESLAVRNFWLCLPQVSLRQGAFYYFWERIGNQHPTLLLVPMSMRSEILQSYDNPPNSGHLGEAKKTLECVFSPSYHNWRGSPVHRGAHTIDARDYTQSCRTIKKTKTEKLISWSTAGLITSISSGHFLCQALVTNKFLLLLSSQDELKLFPFLTKGLIWVQGS